MSKNAKTPALIVLGLWAGLMLPAAECGAAVPREARSIPIQHNGRVKSLDSFARQTVEAIAGKERWNKQDPLSVIWDALAREEGAADMAWIRVSHKELLGQLGLPQHRQYFSYKEALIALDKIESLARAAQAKRDKDLRPSRVEQEAETLYGRLVTVKHLMTGESVRVVPPSEGEDWQSAYQTIDPRAVDFKKLVQLFSEKKNAEFSAQAKAWTQQTHAATRGRFERAIRLEIFYLDVQAFRWSWIAYFLAFVFLSTFKKQRPLVLAGFACLAVAFGMHTTGLVLRILVLARPPVSNMFESMVYMNWALMVFAIGFWAVQRNLVFLSAGAAVSALVMIYGNLLPLDSSLEVLVPVLRSNYWLTVHVLTIVSSYGAFGLATALGHRQLVLKMARRLNKQAEEDSAQLIYRVIQLGVLLLGIGTVLGGVWANESWGRFWGWDPKETWALITFLAYLVVIHLKFSKRIDNFWMAVSAVFGFFFVLMTWYGVNFVLGRGLHSYGFGSGGMMWVTAYVLLELLFVAVVFLKRTVLRHK